MLPVVKRNSYGCLFGGGKHGTCAMLIGPEYENNNIDFVFDPLEPRLYVSGIGGRAVGPNGAMVQKYNQIEWQNRGFLVNVFKNVN